MMNIPTEVAAAIVAAAGTFGSIMLKNWFEKRKELRNKNVVIDSFSNDEAILNKLSEIMDKLGSDRIYILEFHNGGKFYSGRSMQRFTMSYEMCRPGISHEQMKYQGVLLSNYHNFAKAYLQANFIAIDDISKVEDESLRSTYGTEGVESVYACPIKDLNGRVIGLMVVNYIRNKKSLTAQQIGYIKQNAELISGYL